MNTTLLPSLPSSSVSSLEKTTTDKACRKQQHQEQNYVPWNFFMVGSVAVIAVTIAFVVTAKAINNEIITGNSINDNIDEWNLSSSSSNLLNIQQERRRLQKQRPLPWMYGEEEFYGGGNVIGDEMNSFGGTENSAPSPTIPSFLLDDESSSAMTPRDLQLEQGVCDIPIPFDSDRHKKVYTVGVLAIRGAESAYKEFNKTFNEYLTATAGQRFDPPIRFEMKPLNFLTLFTDVEDDIVDYIYVNPSAYSCIESEYDANSLASQVSRRNVGGNIYDLKKFGGVIATLASRDDINSIYDLEDKIVAAASISGLGSGQMQFKEMETNGMNYLQAPKQLVFTSNQGKVVKGVLNGDFDVGFVRTDQLERSKDGDGNPVDLDLFKIIDPKSGLNIDGKAFPFESSTELYPEWNIAALTHVSPDVSREVQRAMLSVADFAKVGRPIVECLNNAYLDGTDTSVCENQTLSHYYKEGPIRCDTTWDRATKAVYAMDAGKYSAWTTSLSYMQLRSMQEATGFIQRNVTTDIWRCIRSTDFYFSISCPDGSERKSRQEVENGCQTSGLECGVNFTCVCRPCTEELVCVDRVKIGDRCVQLGIVLPSIIIPILIIVAFVVHFYVEMKRQQADSVWVVKPTELVFDDPPSVIGRGTFGLVLLADYRGTQVAVKRVIPPGSASSNSLFDVSITSSRSSYEGHFNIDGAGAGTGGGFGGGPSNSGAAAMDMEQGMKSMAQMHPGMKSLAPGRGILKNSQSFHSNSSSRRHNSAAVGNGSALQALEMAAAHDTIISDGNGNGCWSKICCCFTCLSSEDDSQERLKAEFVSEIRHLAKLRHPCITTVMGAVMPTRRDEPMLVMEYMSHGSLYDVLQDDSITLKPEQTLAILQDVAQGLRFLHSATPQVIHGDLKAQNVLIDTNFCAKVTDFGLSAKRHIGAVGTPYWMAPELLKGTSDNTAASDIYAYGIVLYEIYSGRPPYEGEKYDEVMRLVCDPLIKKRPPVPVTCPPRMAKLMTDCLMHAPNERPTAELIDMQLKVEMKVKERTSRLEALNQELEEANNKIATASAMQLQHFACMSHEIRTPLNCIIGLSSLLEETELNPMQKESMEMIVSSGKLLRQIVDDVLDYSKLESGNAEVLIKNINLQDTLNAVVHLIKTSRVTAEKKLKIKTMYHDILPEFVNTDSRRIQQILYNLLGNAIKFSKELGTVEFGVQIVDTRIICFTVKDFGKGIAEKDFNKIFEPFRQTGTGLTNAEGGTGLGLAITKKLVEALGGQICVDSEVGHWTRFTVNFPFTNRVVKIDELSSKLSQTKILLVGFPTIDLPKQNGTNVIVRDTERAKEVMARYRIQYQHFVTMEEISSLITSSSSSGGGVGNIIVPGGKYVCLIHEDLYDNDVYEKLEKVVRTRLVTYGPKFTVDHSKRHYRSLAETFPSVLVSTLVNSSQEMDDDPNNARGKNSIKARVGPTDQDLTQLRILIAEDNLVNQKVLTRMLQRLGVSSVVVVGNGLDAVHREAEEYFDLVLMDMQMPKMDGIEACREISKRNDSSTHPRAKIVFVTAHVSDSFRQTCLDNGAIGYLPKPCTVDGVKEVLKHAMGHGSMFSPVYQESWNNNTSVPPVVEQTMEA